MITQKSKSLLYWGLGSAYSAHSGHVVGESEFCRQKEEYFTLKCSDVALGGWKSIADR